MVRNVEVNGNDPSIQERPRIYPQGNDDQSSQRRKNIKKILTFGYKLTFLVSKNLEYKI